eukprot:GHVT01035603.1.p1 GENE.GHVT01035603.1~~GHVT01035603.1.p1  ORF type:complete len:540 (+),score=158.30 GHVT01035603.1:95-1621(+)
MAAPPSDKFASAGEGGRAKSAKSSLEKAKALDRPDARQTARIRVKATKQTAGKVPAGKVVAKSVGSALSKSAVAARCSAASTSSSAPRKAPVAASRRAPGGAAGSPPPGAVPLASAAAAGPLAKSRASTFMRQTRSASASEETAGPGSDDEASEDSSSGSAPSFGRRSMASLAQPPRAGCVVCIGHLPADFNEGELHRFFRQFGDVRRSRVMRSKRTGRTKGYAFVEFEVPEVAAIAAETMHNYILFGRSLTCRLVPLDKLHPEIFKFANAKPPRRSNRVKKAAEIYNKPLKAKSHRKRPNPKKQQQPPAGPDAKEEGLPPSGAAKTEQPVGAESASKADAKRHGKGNAAAVATPAEDFSFSNCSKKLLAKRRKTLRNRVARLTRLGVDVGAILPEAVRAPTRVKLTISKARPTPDKSAAEEPRMPASRAPAHPPTRSHLAPKPGREAAPKATGKQKQQPPPSTRLARPAPSEKVKAPRSNKVVQTDPKKTAAKTRAAQKTTIKQKLI